MEGYDVVADYGHGPSAWEDAEYASNHFGRPDGVGLRILVVEDDADTAQSTALLLRLYGHRVRVAPDGRAALRLARRARPDVVLLDLGLPGMDGWEVARRLGEQLFARPPFLVALSGYGGEEDRRRSEQAGIHLHLVKPVDPEFLRRLLRRFQEVVMPGPCPPARGGGHHSGRGVDTSGPGLTDGVALWGRRPEPLVCCSAEDCCWQ
jgi:CheY-like chemotaxis protein